MTTTSSSARKEQMSAEFYSSVGSNYEMAFGHDAGLIKFLQRLLPQLGLESKVLDIGCGTGNPVAKTLADAGHHITGIDISDEMIRLSQAAVPGAEFKVADMQVYEPKAKLDAVLAILSLFPLGREQIETQVARWNRWLSKDGVLAICSIAAEDMDVDGSGGKYDDDGFCARDITVRFMGDDVKITLFTREGWKRLLANYGFDVVETMTELFVPPKEADSGEEMHYFLIAKKLS